MPEGCEDPEDLAAEIEDMYPCQEISCNFISSLIHTDRKYVFSNQSDSLAIGV